MGSRRCREERKCLLGQSSYAAAVQQLKAKLAEGTATKVLAAEPQAISNKARRLALRALQHHREEESLRRIAETQKDLLLRENEELKQKLAELEGDRRFLKTKFGTSEVRQSGDVLNLVFQEPSVTLEFSKFLFQLHILTKEQVFLGLCYSAQTPLFPALLKGL